MLLLLWDVREVLILVFIAAVLAAGISPAVHRVRVLGRYRLRRNISRGTAAVIVYFPFLLLVILLAVLMVPRLIGETRALERAASGADRAQPPDAAAALLAGRSRPRISAATA